MDMSVDESVSRDTPTRWKESHRTLLYAAQLGMYEKRSKPFTVLPKYSPVTPGKKVVNPFKTDVEGLVNHTCSPGAFKETSRSSESGEFTWSIEDISRINPALIESSPDQPEEEMEEGVEIKIQQNIERYFSSTHDIASPLGQPGPWLSFESATSTPTPAGLQRTTNSSSTPCPAKSRSVCRPTLDVGVQTMLALPPVLPSELEDILKPYFAQREDDVETDECNLSNSTLRRKLFFDKDELLSPVKRSCPYNPSPKVDLTKSCRVDWTADHGGSNYLSSPDLSPIKDKEEEDKDRLVITEPMNISEGEAVKGGIFTSTIMGGSHDTGYSTLEQ